MRWGRKSRRRRMWHCREERRGEERRQEWGGEARLKYQTQMEMEANGRQAGSV